MTGFLENRLLVFITIAAIILLPVGVLVFVEPKWFAPGIGAGPLFGGVICALIAVSMWRKHLRGR